MRDIEFLSRYIFHIYNRSNNRNTLFHEDENYQFFVAKMLRQLRGACHILAYCVMPNHFHIMLIPKHTLRDNFTLDEEYHDVMPTPELSEAIKRLLMGFTKSYNGLYGLTGSRFQQHTKCKYHSGGLKEGMNYVHFNPSEAGLVNHPSEWQFSSFNEYDLNWPAHQCHCDVELGRALLMLHP